MNHYFTRLLQPPEQSFFLFGPRATGKSTWLKNCLPKAYRLDLLQNDTYFALSSDPSNFRERVLAQSTTTWIVVDEIQRLPTLLHDVHSLIEDHGYRFALSGSSARKLKHGQANLLAGRALVKNMFPLVFAEYKNETLIEQVLQFGTLPSIMNNNDYTIEQLDAYVGTYLREEIKEEALTRNVQAFGRFLEIAAIMNGQITNLANIARDSGVSRSTISTYFEILIDTLLGRWLPSWTPRAKVKEIAHPKFYFFDCGIVRALQKLLRDNINSTERGLLLETMVFHELNAYINYSGVGGELFYWRTTDCNEIDFILQRGKHIICIKVKSTIQ